jgi:Ca2+/H+ antiporter
VNPTLISLALLVADNRLSFVTEQVAEHTNGTIGALLNATFGNAPELLISVAALRSGYYRVVQLTMLGSMITNMIFVFGVACLIGGLRWQVQDIRLTSGNVSVGMLLVATAGSLIPAILILSGQFPIDGDERQIQRIDTDTPTQEEITLSRVNAAVMLMLYICYLIFQLGTHKSEFDDDEHRPSAQPNVFCRKLCSRASTAIFLDPALEDGPLFRGVKKRLSNNITDPFGKTSDSGSVGEFVDEESGDEEEALMTSINLLNDDSFNESGQDVLGMMQSSERRRRRKNPVNNSGIVGSPKLSSLNGGPSERSKSKSFVAGVKSSDDECDASHIHVHDMQHGPLISMRVGIIWLFVITLCISAMSDILVGTIDGFAERMNLSQVFTSMVVVPFFSNVAEQVSAFLFAYRNEMDLCVGVTIGSAIQIATFVLPGSVLIGMFMDRPMTLYFHSYETACLFFCTVVVAAVLQGGTTNWLVGAMLVGIYIMFAAGIWFHEIENLTVNADSGS